MLILFFANALCSDASFQSVGLYPELYHCNRNVSFIIDLFQKIRTDWGRIILDRWSKSSNDDKPYSGSIIGLSQWIAKSKNSQIKVTMKVMTFNWASHLFLPSTLSHAHQSFGRVLAWQHLRKENSCFFLSVCLFVFFHADVKVSHTSASAWWSCFLLFEFKRKLLISLSCGTLITRRGKALHSFFPLDLFKLKQLEHHWFLKLKFLFRIIFIQCIFVILFSILTYPLPSPPNFTFFLSFSNKTEPKRES